MKKEKINSYKADVRRSYSEMAEDFLKQMFFSSPNNSVEWVRFIDEQLRGYVENTKEYYAISGGNKYLYRTERYSMKAQIKKHLFKKGVKYNGHEYKYAKILCNYA